MGEGSKEGISGGRLAAAFVLGLLTLVVFKAEDGRLPLLGDIDLAIHEFGHYLFMPFGETMSIFGGSLTQVMVPLVFAGYFLWSREQGGANRDRLGAIVCLWWAALNLLDVSIYVGDARAGQLMLLSGETGSEGGPHDWRQLLEGWGLLGRDLVYARRMRTVAFLVAISCVAFAVWIGISPPRTKPVVDQPA